MRYVLETFSRLLFVVVGVPDDAADSIGVTFLENGNMERNEFLIFSLILSTKHIQFSNSENIVKIFVFVFVLLNATSLLILAGLSFIQDRLLSTIFVRTCFKPSTHKLLGAGLILSYQ